MTVASGKEDWMELLMLFALGLVVFLVVFGGMSAMGVVPLSGGHLHILWALVFAFITVNLVNKMVLGW